MCVRKQILFCLLIGVATLPSGQTWSTHRQFDPLTVCFKNGCVKGTHMDGYQIESFEAFMGIPYAKPPLGKLRFENPQPIENWAETLDATTPKSACTQKNDLVPGAQVEGSEDCLYLYVYRPKNHSSKKSPLSVMVYIHGGAFFAGTSHPAVTGPQYFMDSEDVILVTMQYRLGAIGFLSTGDQNARGNFGMKDQEMALKWVKENIDVFGGDPNKITIFGQSAGGASVQLHMMRNKKPGLFNKAIVMSGSALAPYMKPTQNPLELAVKQALAVGIQNARNLSTKSLVDELRKVDSYKLVQSIDKLKSWSVDPLTLYRPVVEINTEPQKAFLTNDPKEIWRKGDFEPVPWMTGYVPQEGAVRAIAIVSNETLLKELNSRFDELMPVLLEMTGEKKVVQRMWTQIKQKYFKGANKIDSENVNSFLKLYTDLAFIYPMNKGIQEYVYNMHTDSCPLSLYKFAYKGPLSFSLFYSGGKPKNYGVVHCDDLIHLFYSPALFADYLNKYYSKNSTQAKIIKDMVTFYINFSKNGVASKVTKEEYKTCHASNKVERATDCGFIEFSNSKTNEDLQTRIVKEIDEETIAFWQQFEQ